MARSSASRPVSLQLSAGVVVHVVAPGAAQRVVGEHVAGEEGDGRIGELVVEAAAQVILIERPLELHSPRRVKRLRHALHTRNAIPRLQVAERFFLPAGGGGQRSQEGESLLHLRACLVGLDGGHVRHGNGFTAAALLLNQLHNAFGAIRRGPVVAEHIGIGIVHHTVVRSRYITGRRVECLRQFIHGN